MDNVMLGDHYLKDVAQIESINIVPSLLEVIAQTTKMGFVAVARVTEDAWVACSVRDDIGFGLKPGGQLEVDTTICNEIRGHQDAVVIDDVQTDALYCNHHTPAKYGFRSYISVPINLRDGSFFGTLCAIDPQPNALNTPTVRNLFTHFAELISFHLQAIEEVRHSREQLLKEQALHQQVATLHDTIAQRLKVEVRKNRKIEESEAKLKAILAAAPAAVTLFVGRDLVIENPNQTFIEILGKGPDIAGLPLREVMPELEAEGQPFLKILDEVFLTGVPFHTPASLVKIVNSGVLTEKYFNISYTPVFDATGSIYAILEIAIDVTGEVSAKKALEKNEQNLRNTILQSPVAMCIFKGPEHIVEIANEWMFEFWGKQDHEVLNKPIFEGVPESKGQGFEELLEQVYTKGETVRLTEIPVTLPRAGKLEVVYVDFVYEAFREADDSISGIMAVAHDVTEQVRARREIEQVVRERTMELETANDELKRSNRNLEEFAHAASHDMKEPIRKVLVFSNRLKASLSGRMDEYEIQLFDRMENAAGRMGLLVDDLLEFSHATDQPLNIEVVDLNIKVERVLYDLELEIEQSEAIIHVGKLPVIAGYKRQFQQLFQNLIGNAIKYRKPNQPPVIDISSKEILGKEVAGHVSPELSEQRFHLIEVKDNGIGFDHEYSERIFQMFQRLHGKSEYPGTGIGLSIVRKVVENHHGYVWAESQPGMGATFKVLLPA